MRYKYLVIVLPVLIFLSFSAGAQSAVKKTTDQLGRSITVPDNPQRIVSLAPSITEIIYALGQEHRLAGVSRFSDFPPEAAKLPKVGSFVRLDLERIVALKPDLCIAVKDGNPRAVVERLESLQVPVYVVNPRNLDSMMEAVIEIGALLNAGKKAKSLVQDMRYRIQRVAFLVAKLSSRPRVFYQVGISPIVSAGSDTFIHELILLAGGENLAQGPAKYPRFSREQVLALSPEVFIITSMARGEVFEGVKKEWSRWTSIPAVRDQRIFLVDSNLFDRQTPRLLDGLELLVRLIHPEIFEEEQ
ncbi:MAG: cobalamin-binding protein [Desulfobacterales bacterium]|nr:cobalamin-binding protein [Desulfobacterales bacterium]